jgi:hypothetical protein
VRHQQGNDLILSPRCDFKCPDDGKLGQLNPPTELQLYVR